jgi:hypothetical protein
MTFLDLFKALEEFVIMLKMPKNPYEYSDSEDNEEFDDEPYEMANDDKQNE